MDKTHASDHKLVEITIIYRSDEVSMISYGDCP